MPSRRPTDRGAKPPTTSTRPGRPPGGAGSTKTGEAFCDTTRVTGGAAGARPPLTRRDEGPAGGVERGHDPPPVLGAHGEGVGVLAGHHDQPAHPPVEEHVEVLLLADAVDGGRAMDVHFPRFGEVVLLEIGGKRFVTSLTDRAERVATLVK